MLFTFQLSSFGRLDLKYFIYCILYAILEIYINCFIYDGKENENILHKHKLLDSFCFYIGYLLNIIPAMINYIYNKPFEKKLSGKDIIKFLFICFILLLTDFIEITLAIISKDNDENEEDYLFLGFIIVFYYLYILRK